MDIHVPAPASMVMAPMMAVAPAVRGFTIVLVVVMVGLFGR